MTPDERDRLLRVELNAANQAMSAERISDKVDRLDAKVDELLKAAHMGQGAWWALLRVGAVLVAAATAVSAVATAGVWVLEKLHIIK